MRCSKNATISKGPDKADSAGNGFYSFLVPGFNMAFIRFSALLSTVNFPSLRCRVNFVPVIEWPPWLTFDCWPSKTRTFDFIVYSALSVSATILSMTILPSPFAIIFSIDTFSLSPAISFRESGS